MTSIICLILSSGAIGCRSILSMKKMLENGVHFGHQTRRWNPKMKPFIYTSRNGVYIVDLNQTQAQIEAAYNELKAISERGGKVLFVGIYETKL